MKSDIEIARETKLKNIREVAAKVGFPDEDVFNYGKYIAKIPYRLIDEEKVAKHHLILVTAITATKAGVGKTTVSIGLGMGLNHIGKNAIIALREPSLGPVFGIKGGATGGGYAQVAPMEEINLHFTGDLHAITSANNLIAAAIDNHIYQGNELDLDLERITFKRCVDLNDRSLRNVILKYDNKGLERKDKYNITVASEMMAILCLATSKEDFLNRVNNIASNFLIIIFNDIYFYITN